MAHMIEQFSDGTAAFFSNREVPWHRLGTVTDGALTAEEALKVARLDWTVNKTEDPIAAPVLTESGLHLITHEERFLTYRQNPETNEYEALGVVGSQYHPIQNVEAFDFLNNLVDESGAHFETAGSLAGGRRVFMSMKMPEHMTIGGVDNIDLYLLAWNSHDGMSAFNVIATPIRVVCQNTLTAGIRSAKASWSIRHDRTAKSKVQAARETLGLAFTYADEFQKEAEAMLAEQMVLAEFERVVRDELVKVDANATDRVKANAEQTAAEIIALWDAPTQANVAGTKWAAWNAVTEWADWVKDVKGKDEDEARARRIVTDLAALDRSQRPLDIKRKAWRVLANA